jgi:CMP-N-acetylneuraminic acid synthetase
MIPARIGSKRIKMKNLRYLGEKPLIYYSIEAAINSKVFDEIYLNSDSDIFEEIALNHGINFYKRPENLGSDKTNNDDFATDFMKNIDGDILIQLLPTSPFIDSLQIKSFVEHMKNNNFETLISVIEHKIASIYNNNPINFELLEPHISSQEMIPLKTYATVLMGWTYESFLNNIKNLGFAYHGGNSKIGYFSLSGLSEIDIDNESDFQLAEAALNYFLNNNNNNNNNNNKNKIRYYGKSQN